jgi:regulatory protein
MTIAFSSRRAGAAGPDRDRQTRRQTTPADAQRADKRRQTDQQASETGGKRQKPVTADYLRKSAMHYLSQRSASSSMLRQILVRRSIRRLSVKTLEPDTLALIDGAIAGLTHLGIVDDSRFAEGRATTLAGRGQSKSRIAAGLKAKGITADIIAASDAAHVDDLAQARRTVQRKRLGPYRCNGQTQETRRKDLAALARAGFSYTVAKSALEAAEAEQV